LIGNKKDLESRKIETNRGQDKASKWNCSYLETSAKTGENVGEVFTSIVRQIKQMKSEKQPKKAKKKGGCILL